MRSLSNCSDFSAGFTTGGLFVEPSVPDSFVLSVCRRSSYSTSSLCLILRPYGGGRRRRRRREAGDDVVLWRGGRGRFSSVTLSTLKVGEGEGIRESFGKIGEDSLEIDRAVGGVEEESVVKIKFRGNRGNALNTAKHLWAGAVAAMVSRTFVAPLERLKLEYIVRGEQKHLNELIKRIFASEGLKGFWKGNFLNILRTAPFKAINFYAYDTYRNQLLKLSGNEEVTNFERFVAGAAAGVTATVLCLPMDTIRTVMVAPGGEALGGLIGAFHHMIQAEGFFSLYKGLVPSMISMAPAGAVFYGVYDILKSAYLRSPEGRRKLEQMKQQGDEMNAFEQLELGPMRTLLYGAIAGCCSEAATYPFEVVRRQLQMQVRATKMSALATAIKIVEQGGVPALYTGLIPSLLQVLPSAAISYLVYEFMKIVLKVE